VHTNQSMQIPMEIIFYTWSHTNVNPIGVVSRGGQLDCFAWAYMDRAEKGGGWRPATLTVCPRVAGIALPSWSLYALPRAGGDRGDKYRRFCRPSIRYKCESEDDIKSWGFFESTGSA